MIFPLALIEKQTRNSVKFFTPLFSLALAFIPNLATAQETTPTSANNPQLKQALQLFPQADANRDGILTLEEAGTAATLLGFNIDDLKAQISQGSPTPTKTNVPYGHDKRQILDFWKPESPGPTPLVILIHGGGFKYGSKDDPPKMLGPLISSLLRQGIAVASINYRLVRTAPLQESLKDGARAVQFLRSKAAEWNLDKDRFGAVGGSAGAGMSLWLSTRDDLADSASEDPVIRESSRVGPIVLLETQATYNLPRWEIFLGKPGFESPANSMATAFHLPDDSALQTPEGRLLLKEVDMLEWIGKGDGPILTVLTRYGAGKADTNNNMDGYMHSSKHSSEIKRVCDEKGVSCEITSNKLAITDFLLKQLKPQR